MICRAPPSSVLLLVDSNQIDFLSDLRHSVLFLIESTLLDSIFFLIYYAILYSTLFLISSPLCVCLYCPVLSCPVLSCPVLSCPVLSCPVLPCPLLSSPLFALGSYWSIHCSRMRLTRFLLCPPRSSRE